MHRAAAICLDSAAWRCCGSLPTAYSRSFASSSKAGWCPGRQHARPSQRPRECSYSMSTTATATATSTGLLDIQSSDAELAFDRKGKGRAPEYVYDKSMSYYRLQVPGKDLVSLARVQSYVELYKTNQVAILHLVLWILSRRRPARNDVQQGKRRWRALVYWHKGRSIGEQISPSLDVLCAEILKTEVDRSSGSSAQVRVLLLISIKALVGRAHRTLAAIGDLLASDEWRSHLEGDSQSREALLQLQGIIVSHQSQFGWWDIVFAQRDKIVKIMKEQKEFSVLHEGSESRLQMDIILLRSLLGHRAEEGNFDKEDDEYRHTLGKDLASDQSFLREVKTLYHQMEQIYGQVSDIWLAELIKALALGIRIGISRRPFTVEDYNTRLPVWRTAMDLFDAHCQRHLDRAETPPEELLQPMLSLHINLAHYCGQWETSSDQQGASRQSLEHRARIGKINSWLTDSKRQNEVQKGQERKVSKGNTIRLDDIQILQAKARAVHTQTRLLLIDNDWTGAIAALKTLCDEVGPDEAFHRCVVSEEAAIHDKMKIVARAMMQTRRLIRGTFIGILVHLDRCSDGEKRKSMPLLLPVLVDSISRGLWDRWALWDANTRKRLKLLNYPALLIDPPAELASFFCRLLNMCCPARAVHQNSVERGFHVLNGAELLPTYWLAMASYAEAVKAVQKRSEFLKKQGLLSSGYHRTASSPDRALDRYVTQYGTGGASGIWAAFLDAEETEDVVLPRLRLLLHDIYLPLRLNRSGWKAATIALQQVCPASAAPPVAAAAKRTQSAADRSILVWSLFQEARQRGMEQLEPVQNANLDPQKRTVQARKNLQWRNEQKRRKSTNSHGWGARP